MRLDGLEDLECLPCGPAPFRNIMCSREYHTEKYNLHHHDFVSS